MKENVKVVETGNHDKHGENRCPQCEASDVTYNIKKKKLVCNYCFTEFDAENVEEIEKDVSNLNEEIRGSGTKDIDNNVDDIITLKCGGCGAEVVINTKESVNARCHWCRSILSINSQIENGAVPDVVLPFDLDKKVAEEKIKDFVEKRKFFAHPIFKKEFTTNNVMGVFFPYMLVDANCHGSYSGEGGHVARSYEIVVGKDDDGKEKKETVYDIDVFHIERDFDIAIDDLSIESSLDKLNKSNKTKTTNIINSIMPFDTAKCVKYNSNYLAGYTSEKRDVNVGDLEEKVFKELKDVTRHALNSDLKYYDSGVKWDKEELNIKGKQWISAYLPVWLYSYQDTKKTLHYVAVNGCTGETMGSIPMNKRKLFFISLLIDILIFAVIFYFTNESDNTGFLVFYLFLIVGPIYYHSKLSKYRNKNARHKYETETKNTVSNMKKVDEKNHTLREQSSRSLPGANNYKLDGEQVKIKGSK